MIERDLAGKALSMAGQFPVVSITGPRQSGKTTIVRAAFPGYSYVSLEDADTRAFAADDPRAFLARYGRRTIIDEAQRVPDLFSFMQGIVDETGEPGQFVVSGSQNFLLMEAIDQSLAGRVAVLNLLPLSYAELCGAGLAPEGIDDWILAGGYPRIYDRGIAAADYYPNYLRTYVERDVRSMTGITKLAEFQRLLALCAARTSEALNIQALSRDCGVAVNTVREWLSVLEASFLVHLLRPYHRNLGKRITKTPKLYLLDQGLASNLVGMEDPDDIRSFSGRGGLFETAVLAEVVKAYYARGRVPKLFYWRDAAKREIDILVERGPTLTWAIEVKSSSTYYPKYFRHLDTVANELGVPPERRMVVYAGDETYQTSHGLVCSLRDLGSTL